MAEDLSQYIERDPDGRPRLRPGLMTLPPMGSASPPAKRQTSTTGTSTDRDGRKAGEPKRKGTGDRFKVLNAFVDVTMRDLTPSEKLVWFVLFRDIRDGVAKAAQSDIATRSGLTQSTVSLAIKRLAKRGLLRVVRQGGFRQGLSTYRIRGSV